MNAKELQEAIYTRVNTQVGGSVSGVYTDPPQAAQSEDDSAFPFITIGPVSATPNDTKGDNGFSTLFDVHIWSRSSSALTWRSIGDQVYDALQKYDALPVVGANVVDCRFDSSTNFDDPDGRTKHYVLTFRVNYFLT